MSSAAGAREFLLRRNHHDVISVRLLLSQNVPSHPLIRPLSSQLGQNHNTSKLSTSKRSVSKTPAGTPPRPPATAQRTGLVVVARLRDDLSPILRKPQPATGQRR